MYLCKSFNKMKNIQEQFMENYKKELTEVSAKDNSNKRKIFICVDFDGTIVKHKYPLIGDENPSAFDIMIDYEKKYNVAWILNTMRSGKLLDKAVTYCNRKGIEFYGVNRNPSQNSWTDSPKAYGQFYIDDCNVGQPLIFEDGERPYVDWIKTDKILRPILEYLSK